MKLTAKLSNLNSMSLKIEGTSHSINSFLNTSQLIETLLLQIVDIAYEFLIVVSSFKNFWSFFSNSSLDCFITSSRKLKVGLSTNLDGSKNSTLHMMLKILHADYFVIFQLFAEGVDFLFHIYVELVIHKLNDHQIVFLFF